MLFTFTTRQDAIDHVETRLEQQGGNPGLYCIESFIIDLATELFPQTVVDIPPGPLADQLAPYAHTTGKVTVDLFSGTVALIDGGKEEIVSARLPEIQALRSALLAQWDAWGVAVDPAKIRFTAPFRAHTIIKDVAA